MTSANPSGNIAAIEHELARTTDLARRAALRKAIEKEHERAAAAAAADLVAEEEAAREAEAERQAQIAQLREDLASANGELNEAIESYLDAWRAFTSAERSLHRLRVRRQQVVIGLAQLSGQESSGSAVPFDWGLDQARSAIGRAGQLTKYLGMDGSVARSESGEGADQMMRAEVARQAKLLRVGG